MRPLPCLAAALAAAVAVCARPAAGGTGDALCDVTRSTPETCVIVGAHVVPDTSEPLTFDRPNVRLEGSLTVTFTGVCALAESTRCENDTGCAEAAPCLRTGRLAMAADGLLAVARRGRIDAVGRVLATDRAPHDGGAISLRARDVAIEGMLSVAAEGRPGVRAGSAGAIAIDADSSVTLADTGALDGSTPTGPCGGRVTIGGRVRPRAIELHGAIGLEAATMGGTLEMDAAEQLTLAGPVQVSNTNQDRARRPVCEAVRDERGFPVSGGGTIDGESDRIELLAPLRAIGRQAGGGTVSLVAGRSAVVDLPGPEPAINVSGGEVDAFSIGGEVILVADGGDVIVRRGAIEASGEVQAFGPDGGDLLIVATRAQRCQESGAQCRNAGDCPRAEACVEVGGDVQVDVPLSARGGFGGDFAITGAGSVRVSGPVDADGALAQSGAGGFITITAGDELVAGPGVFSATGVDGGIIDLTAGDPSAGIATPRGELHIAGGTGVRAVGATLDGLGGSILVVGCDVTVGANAWLDASGRPTGGGGDILVAAHERLTVEPLTRFASLPDAVVELVYRQEAIVSPDASFRPNHTLEQATALPPCPSCGNGVRESPAEECDGRGSCPDRRDVCVFPGLPMQCSCIDTCGRPAGTLNPGEQCDGTNLGGQTCQTLGFLGGTLGCAADCTFDTATCLAAICGDGITGPGEACDPGGIDGAAPDFGGRTCASEGFPAGGVLTCSPDCLALITVPHCAATVGAACTVNADCGDEACVGGCAQCGNHFLDPSEECDAGVDNSDVTPDACRTSCRLPSCGDGVVDPGVLDECDDGPDNGPDRPCTDACRAAVCGDGATCSFAACGSGPGGGPEQCDDGNATLGDACGTSKGGPCALPSCGNDSVEPGEECDDGNLANDDGCDANCTRSRCGNGIVNRAEDCDPPDATCCLADCTRRRCDDGNPCTTDRCDPTAGCAGIPAPGTACDDGDRCTVNDTCSPSGACTGAALACVATDACLVAGTCHPATGCVFVRQKGFAGLGCLPASDLATRLEHFSAEAPRRRLRQLSRAAARAAARIGQAADRGPGRSALRYLTVARRLERAVMDGLSRLRIQGRIDQAAAQEMINQAADVLAGLEPVIAELRPPR